MGLERCALSRRLNTFALGIFLTHVACAFHFYHGWSHSAAYAETARETAKSVGWNWGGGLYFNYLFTLVWAGQAAWSWRNRDERFECPNGVTWAWRGFFLFMMVNGAVVFAHGALRWLGLVLCLMLAGSWWGSRRITGAGGPSKPL
jgi:hypothetical protein